MGHNNKYNKKENKKIDIEDITYFSSLFLEFGEAKVRNAHQVWLSYVKANGKDYANPVEALRFWLLRDKSEAQQIDCQPKTARPFQQLHPEYFKN